MDVDVNVSCLVVKEILSIGQAPQDRGCPRGLAHIKNLSLSLLCKNPKTQSVPSHRQPAHLTPKRTGWAYKEIPHLLANYALFLSLLMLSITRSCPGTGLHCWEGLYSPNLWIVLLQLRASKLITSFSFVIGQYTFVSKVSQNTYPYCVHVIHSDIFNSVVLYSISLKKKNWSKAFLTDFMIHLQVTTYRLKNTDLINFILPRAKKMSRHFSSISLSVAMSVSGWPSPLFGRASNEPRFHANRDTNFFLNFNIYAYVQ